MPFSGEHFIQILHFIVNISPGITRNKDSQINLVHCYVWRKKVKTLKWEFQLNSLALYHFHSRICNWNGGHFVRGRWVKSLFCKMQSGTVITLYNIIYSYQAKPWIPGGKKSVFTVVIHVWRSPLRQFARARTMDEYDVTMQVLHVRLTPEINCGDVTMLSQKGPYLGTMAKSAINNF